MALEKYIIDTMFEQSLFSDLSLAFYHSVIPRTMRFNVHRAIIGQSPFLRLLLNNTHRINTVDNNTSCQQISITSQQQQQQQQQNLHDSTLHLTIDLVQAMTLRGFLMTPPQHIFRRQWQPSTFSTRTTNDTNNTPPPRHIESSHIRFVLKWLYSTDRTPLISTMEKDDTLRILCVAILFDLEPLVDACLDRYTTSQLSIDTVVNDLETICQLPRDHNAYHQLRDAALLLLLRYGPENPEQLARLPVDYMSDVLCADLLFVGCEFDRYRLLHEVLVAFMRSVGRITWTVTGPLDQDDKRLSGFIYHPMFTQQQQLQIASDTTITTSKKRKLVETSSVNNSNNNSSNKQRCLSRINFSSRVPFEQLAKDTSSGGGVLDKGTILSYLLRTTVNYSNMTFDQLSIVRQDRIVDEGIVFKALWQREALERLLFPFNYQQSQQPLQQSQSQQPLQQSQSQQPLQQSQSQQPLQQSQNQQILQQQQSLQEKPNQQVITPRSGTTTTTMDDQQGLLGAPHFRFPASVRLNLPNDTNHVGWRLNDLATTSKSILPRTLSEQSQSTQQNNTSSMSIDQLGGDEGSKMDDDDDDDDTNFDFDEDDMDAIRNCESFISTLEKEEAYINSQQLQQTQQQQQQQQQQHTSERIYNTTVYSDTKYILGQWHRVCVEAQVLPRYLLQIQDDDDDQVDGDKNDNRDATPVLVCRFELQRDRANSSHYHNSTQDVPKEPAQQQSKIHYAIYCLNRHDGLVKNQQVDREDRVLVPVTEATEMDDSGKQTTGYVGQVLINTDALENNQVVDLDMMVALDICGFKQQNVALS